jgi:2,3-bisphosphoglycerate-dependent phosphoglycerate mutase
MDPRGVEVWLVRHGQTDWNKEGRYQGQRDIPLNADGMAQAAETAGQLVRLNLPFGGIFSSDLLRARQTAGVIGERLDLPIFVDPRLREISLGSWEGQRHIDVAGPGLFMDESGAADIDQPYAPGGESVLSVAQRGCQALDAIAASHPGQRLIVVAHGLILATIRCAAGGIGLNEFPSQSLENAEIARIFWPRR